MPPSTTAVASPAPAARPPVGEILGLTGSVLLALSLLVLPWHSIDLRLSGGEVVRCTAVECVNEGAAVLAGLAAVAAAACCVALLAMGQASEAARRLVAVGATVASLVALGALGVKYVQETEYIGYGAPVAIGLGVLALIGSAVALALPSPEPPPPVEGSPWGWDQAPPEAWDPWGPGWTMPEEPPMAVAEAPAPGWWLASDGRWYPPEQHPHADARPSP